MGNLNNVFNPCSIALIGASDREGSVGRITLTNLLQAKDKKIFAHTIYSRSADSLPMGSV